MTRPTTTVFADSVPRPRASILVAVLVTRQTSAVAMAIFVERTDGDTELSVASVTTRVTRTRVRVGAVGETFRVTSGAGV